MGDVALSRIVSGGKGEWDRVTGIYREEEAPTVFMPGDEVSGLSDEEMESLRANGAVGDPSSLVTSAQSTAAMLQSEEAEAQRKADQDAASGLFVNTPAPGPATEEEQALALATRTDQVARAAGEEPTTEAGTDEEAAPEEAPKATATSTRSRSTSTAK